jgi:hypothetical protein
MGGIVRALAAIVGLWLVVGGALARRHEAQVAHVLDRASGLVIHGQQLAAYRRGYGIALTRVGDA